MLPVQISWRDLEPSDAVRERIEKKAAELLRFDDRILGCRVLVEAHHKHHRKGKLYHVRVDLDVPGAEIVVGRDPSEAHEHEDVYVAIRDAFASAARRVQDQIRRRRGDVKSHEAPAHGRIVRLFPHEGYGFIEGADGLEIYFHRNSVAEDAFDRLEIGGEVRYVVREGESVRAPQASTVTPIGKHHIVAPPA